MIKSEKKEQQESILDEEVSVKDQNTDSSEEKTTEEKFLATQDKLLRTMAEMENQRRRFEKEKKDAFEFGGFNFAAESLSVIDNIERAVISFKNNENLKDKKDLDKIIESMEIVKKDLISIFKKNGVEAIECINKKFDPNFHQAMLEVEEDAKDPGMVVQEIQRGYMMKGRLLRPSLVGVSKKTTKKT